MGPNRALCCHVLGNLKLLLSQCHLLTSFTFSQLLPCSLLFPKLQSSQGSTTPLKMPQPAKRPLDQPSINVKVKSQDGRQLFFRINRSTPLQKLLVAYCQRMNVDYKTMQFVYNGDRVAAKRTPEQLGMEDGDEIDALTHQMGGGCREF